MPDPVRCIPPMTEPFPDADFQAFLGVGGRDPVLQGEYPGKVHDGLHGTLDIEGIAMTASGFHDKIAEKSQRRLELQGIFGKVSKKTGPSGQALNSFSRKRSTSS
jgi:hypothetical protein